mmetsp:Transcript_13412/g.22838  ORF Transcript_13412/g.22838 Transcript_13412/m.22838 type:complete len:173 (-) Transcript_13412:1009-1527(-)
MAPKKVEDGQRPTLPKMSFAKLMDDCDRPACSDTMEALSQAMKRMETKQSVPGPSTECPPNSPELGRASWTLLHSMAAWFPDHPKPEDEQLVTHFMSALARFYPCTWCAADFQENLQTKPVRTETREDLCLWLCEQHNLVNEKLGKPLFKCDIKLLDERWRKNSNPSCQSDH